MNKKTRPLTDLSVGDIFNFVGAPEHVHTVAATFYKEGGGCGMGLFPGRTTIVTTEGYWIRTDDWCQDAAEIHKEKNEYIIRNSNAKIPGWPARGF
jgi:hypothetical protein